ncbi:MAG: hypothetical protein ACKOFX_04810 [Solirubrobacterales bacterium]
MTIPKRTEFTLIPVRQERCLVRGTVDPGKQLYAGTRTTWEGYRFVAAARHDERQPRIYRGTRECREWNNGDPEFEVDAWNGCSRRCESLVE